jgi:tripartite-type tricarboxylate transporter receptor subunit TctC
VLRTTGAAHHRRGLCFYDATARHGTRFMQTWFTRIGAVLAASFLCTCALAQETAGRPIKLVVPYPAGGVVDFQARVLATGLRRALHQELAVDNISGGAGAIGLQHLASAPADGQEIGMGTDSDTILAPMLNPDLKHTPGQFRLLGMVASAPMAIVATPQLEGSLSQVLTNSRRDAKELTFGNYGTGSNADLLAKDLAHRSGVQVLHVPYRGIAPLLQDLMSGQVEMAYLPLAASIPDMVSSGRLRLMAVASEARLTAFPQVPTLAEATGLPDMVHRSWSGLMLPRATPAAITRRLHAALQETLASAEVRSQLEKSGLDTGPSMTLDEAQRYLDSEVARYRRLLAPTPTSPTSATSLQQK